jgi:hypothetical protein
VSRGIGERSPVFLDAAQIWLYGHIRISHGSGRTGKFLLVTRYWESGVSVLPWNAADGTIGEVRSAM